MAETEPSKHAEDAAGEASAEQGVVVLDGPDGVAVTMNPDAARATGEKLIAAAYQAQAQGDEEAAKGAGG